MKTFFGVWDYSHVCVFCSGLNAAQCVCVYWELFDTINTHTEALLALTFSQFAALCDHIYVKLIIMFATATKHLAVSDVRKRTCAGHTAQNMSLDGERDREWRRGSHMILFIIVATSQTLKRRRTHWIFRHKSIRYCFIRALWHDTSGSWVGGLCFAFIWWSVSRDTGKEFRMWFN